MLLSRHRDGRYVVLKLLRTDASVKTQEQAMHEKLTGKIRGKWSAEFVTELLRSFKIKGPNGVHTCLVFEPMGPSAEVMKEELPEFKPRKIGLDIRFRTYMAKSILKQLLQGLAHLHGEGICHGDVQPGNILFEVPQIESVEADDLAQPETEAHCFPVKRLDKKPPAPSAPEYLTLHYPLVELVDIEPGFKVKLSDLGAAYEAGSLPEEDVTPTGLRTPEAILTGKANQTQDIWSFGCLVFELLTGTQLFSVDEFSSNEEKIENNHLLQLCDTLGPLPPDLMTQWKNASKFFDSSSGKQIRSWLGEKMPELSDKIPRTPEDQAKIARLKEDPSALKDPPLAERFMARKPADMSISEAAEVIALIHTILRYNPEDRPTTAALLEHPWFAGINVHAGKKTHGASAARTSYAQLAKRFVQRCVSSCKMM